MGLSRSRNERISGCVGFEFGLVHSFVASVGGFGVTLSKSDDSRSEGEVEELNQQAARGPRTRLEFVEPRAVSACARFAQLRLLLLFSTL